ncbi:ABC transporter permease [Catenovulum agarivorans]|uniref:ABC transporter permease n=1 Tax=Catenovulum agarivorans TaxID=1172192 RepID=UPI0002FBAECD|nr:DUF3526 domain-containing protein [Catenovulum agarivorans]
MSTLLIIAHDEWRYWRRSKLALVTIIISIVMALTSVVLTTISVADENHQRAHLQQQAEQTFVEQPDRHPHRMVHYGHYLFRNSTPLSTIDPGIDSYTGKAIFLEGHRQNSATFSNQQHSSQLTEFGPLSPAFVLQTIAPLLLILIGYSAISRETEAGTLSFLLAQGLSYWQLLLGKVAALFSVNLLVLSPFILGCLLAASHGESSAIIVTFILSYLVYLLVWTLFIVAISALTNSNNSSFAMLICCWLFACLLLPRIAANTTQYLVEQPSKIENDFAVKAKLRELGDGHNSADPAFLQLKANLLAQYQVEKVEDLPVNFRGIVAKNSEAELTKILNTFAKEQMQRELKQSTTNQLFAWLTPALAIRGLSMQLAGTDISSYHKFLREAEQVRYEFVQSLNKAHAEQLNYQTDINRYQDSQALQNARVSANNWQILNNFEFKPFNAEQRLTQSKLALMQLTFWLIILAVFLGLVGRKSQC